MKIYIKASTSMNISLVKSKESNDEYSGHEIFYDIVRDGDVVGLLHTIEDFDDPFDDCCYVERIDVFEEYRNQGIGSFVLQRAIPRELGYSDVIVAPDNSDARRLYERIGEPLEDVQRYSSTDNPFDYLDQGYGVYVI